MRERKLNKNISYNINKSTEVSIYKFKINEKNSSKKHINYKIKEKNFIKGICLIGCIFAFAGCSDDKQASDKDSQNSTKQLRQTKVIQIAAFLKINQIIIMKAPKKILPGRQPK